MATSISELSDENTVSALERCFHCGDRMPPHSSLRVEIDGCEQPVCCIGCQQVALLIRGANLTAFYRERTDFSPTPADEHEQTAAWFSDEQWVRSFAQQNRDGDLVLSLLVGGMTCAACTWLIERTLEGIPGVRRVDINLSLSRLTLTLEPGASAAMCVGAIEQLGYSVRPWRTDDRLEQLRADTRRAMRRLGVAAIGMMQAGMFAIALHAGALQGIDEDLRNLLRWFSAPIAVFVLIYSGRGFLQNAWNSLRQGQLIMDSSVSLALLLGTGASLWATFTGTGETYYDSVTMFIFFLLLARFVEQRLRNTDLLRLVRIEDQLPEFVSVMRTGQWTRVPRATINIGERIRIPTGEAVAFDCEVLRGESLIDEAVFTGEALPRRVQPGDALFAGTVNRDASIEAEVNSSYRDSRLAALQERIATARRGKPKYLRLIDRWAAQFVSFVIIAAALTALGWATIDPERSLWTALAVLVVACPCALSLATPATLASATAWLQQRNIWVHGEYGLLAAPNVDLLLIDKTGTLTDTNLTLAQVHTSPRLSKTEALSVAAAIQQFSQHPAAKPFHQHPAAAGVDAVEAVPGRGMVAQWRGRQLRLGSYEYCAELGSIPATPDDSHYWVALADSEGWLAWFGLGEALRPDAVALMDAVRQRGIDVKIVSGDRNTRVAAIAEQLGVEFQGGATPADKLAIIRDAQSKKRTVLAVGDGLNDAPFLGAADVSIAVANATALTRVEADFAIDEARLDRIITILEISDQNRRVTRQNLLWAASYNLLGIPLAAVGWVPPWLAAIGMSLSSLLVVLNALRLRRYRERSP